MTAEQLKIAYEAINNDLTRAVLCEEVRSWSSTRKARLMKVAGKLRRKINTLSCNEALLIAAFCMRRKWI